MGIFTKLRLQGCFALQGSVGLPSRPVLAAGCQFLGINRLPCKVRAVSEHGLQLPSCFQISSDAVS